MESYADFSRMLEIAKVYRNPHVSFEAICKVLEVSPSDLDEIVMEETGFSGEGLIERYRSEPL